MWGVFTASMLCGCVNIFFLLLINLCYHCFFCYGILKATPRSALRCVGPPAQARSVSFAEGVRGDARECLTRARRERRAERLARRPTRASRVVVEESARSRTPPRHRGRAPPPSPPEASRGRAARRGRGPRG